MDSKDDIMPLNVSTDNLTQTYDEVNADVLGNLYSANMSDNSFYFYFFDAKSFFSQFPFQLDMFISNYIRIVVAIIAFIGNFIIVLVLMQKRSRSFSTSVYITSLAVADFCCSLSLLEGWLFHYKFIKATYADIDCKLRLFLPKATQYVSVWMLVFIALERALSVKVPFKVKTICTLRFARCCVIIVWILSFALTALNASMIYRSVSERLDECFVNSVKYRDLYYLDLVLYTVLQVLIPYPIILVCTVLTISTLLQNTLRKSKSKNESPVKSITITLVLVNVVYLVCITPAVVIEIHSLFWIRLNKFLTLEDYNYFVVRTNLSSFLAVLHHCLNIFIYFLGGSRFRKETKDLFRSCVYKKEKQLGRIVTFI